MLKNFAFIVKAPGYLAEIHHAELVSDDFSTHVIGVFNLGEAIRSAKKLIEDGVQLIELCGGFSEDDAAVLRLQTGHQVPVGVVVYSPRQAAELLDMFGESAPPLSALDKGFLGDRLTTAKRHIP